MCTASSYDQGDPGPQILSIISSNKSSLARRSSLSRGVSPISRSSPPSGYQPAAISRALRSWASTATAASRVSLQVAGSVWSVRLHEDVLPSFVDGDEPPALVAQGVEPVLQGVAPFLVVHGHNLIVHGATLDHLRVGWAVLTPSIARSAVRIAPITVTAATAAFVAITIAATLIRTFAAGPFVPSGGCGRGPASWIVRHRKPPGNRRCAGGGGMACPPIGGHISLLTIGAIMASRQAAHACRRAGASAVPASMRLRGLHALQVSSAAHPHRPHGRPTRQRERPC